MWVPQGGCGIWAGCLLFSRLCTPTSPLREFACKTRPVLINQSGKMLAKSVLTDKNKGSRTGVGWNRREPAKAWFEHVDSEEETGAKGEATHAEDWNCKQPELRDEKHNVLPFSIIQSIVQVVGFITGIRNKRNKVLTLVMDTTWLLCIARPKT